MSGYPAQPYSVILDQVIANGGTSGPSVDLSNYVQKWNDPTGLGTDVLVGMIELKLWDNSLGAYASLKTQEGTLQYNNDPVAMEDDSSSTLRRRGITLYDPVGDGDYFLQVTNEGLVFNGSPVAPREDLASPLGTAYVRLYDGGEGEWSQLQSIDGVLRYTNAVTAEVQPVVVNVNRTNAQGIQGFNVAQDPFEMLSVNIASQGLGDGFPSATLTFDADQGFTTQQDGINLTVRRDQASFNGGPFSTISIGVNPSGYFVTHPANFRQAISAAPVFDITNADGNQIFDVTLNPAGYCTLFFRSNAVGDFPQLQVTANAEEGFQVSYGLSNFWMTGQDVTLRADGVLDLAATSYGVENPDNFRTAISAVPTFNINDAEGINQFAVTPDGTSGASFVFASAKIASQGYVQLLVSVDAETGLNVTQGSSLLRLTDSGIRLVGTEIELDSTDYIVNNATVFREAITAQETLVSGMNIKTINGNSILGAGNLVVSGGGGGGATINDMAYLALALGGP